MILLRLVPLLALGCGSVSAQAPPAPQSASRAVILVEGKFGKALDARQSPVLVAGQERFRQPAFTVECWTKLSSKEPFNVLVSCDPKASAQHWEIYSYAGSGVFSAYLPGSIPSEINSDAVIADRRWHHVAMTHDGKTVRLYVDGKRVKEQAVQRREGLKSIPGPLLIGEADGGNHRVGCDGLIDDVRISKTARLIDGLPKSASADDGDTIGLWRFDQEEGLIGDPAWTPPPQSGKVEPWEKETDKDWVDDRLRTMDTGPAFNATFEYPGPKGKERVYQGTAIRIGETNEAAVLFDRNQMRFAAAWTGGYLNHSNRRFGLLNTPTPAGSVLFRTASGPGWADADGKWENSHPATPPLPKEWAKFKGVYLDGKRTVLRYTVGKTEVLESPTLESTAGWTVFTRTLDIAPSAVELRCLVTEFPKGDVRKFTSFHDRITGLRQDGSAVVILALGKLPLELRNDGRVEMRIPAGKERKRVKLLMASGTEKAIRDLDSRFSTWESAGDLQSFCKGGPARWTQPIVTRGEVAPNDGPYVVDTLTVPYENPYRAMMFCSGVDTLPNGDLAVCTAHGDVWLVRGVDAKLEKLAWKRFATGLYQPLGLKVVGGIIHVLQRGQLTRLHDLNDDGEADYYETLNNDWHTEGGEHSYDTCLETDPDGNFYFFKTGDVQTPTGGCLLRVTKDGQKCEVFSTGFRHPIGLGISPRGKVTGADQEGNWMPATRIDLYKKDGFYGDFRAHHRKLPPKIYDEPLLWLPREADNSAGGQVSVPEGKFGPLSGHLLHLSYGRCRMLLVLPQYDQDLAQAGAIDLGLFFLSGVMRGRFSPIDGNLYVCGLRGWQNAARKDGCLQRVRYTGKPTPLPIAMEVQPGGIELKFAQELDKKTAEDVKRYRLEQWNYRWSGEYGSRHWSVVDPNREAHDPVLVSGATLSEDRRGVFLKIPDLKPVMQMRIEYRLQTADGMKLEGKLWNTVNFTK